VVSLAGIFFAVTVRTFRKMHGLYQAAQKEMQSFLKDENAHKYFKKGVRICAKYETRYALTKEGGANAVQNNSIMSSAMLKPVPYLIVYSTAEDEDEDHSTANYYAQNSHHNLKNNDNNNNYSYNEYNNGRRNPNDDSNDESEASEGVEQIFASVSSPRSPKSSSTSSTSSASQSQPQSQVKTTSTFNGNDKQMQSESERILAPMSPVASYGSNSAATKPTIRSSSVFASNMDALF